MIPQKARRASGAINQDEATGEKEQSVVCRAQWTALTVREGFQRAQPSGQMSNR